MELVRKLASGGMAEVWVARVGRELVAVKRLASDHLGKPELLALFRREQEVAPTLVDDHLVRSFGAELVGGLPSLVMELVEGESLSRLRARLAEGRRPVPVELAAEIARRVALGLAALHERTHADGSPAPLVHCDVSPSNVLVSRTGTVKLADFGVTQPAGATAETFLGKPGYAAPEQFKGAPLDARTDLFSLGVLLHEMVTGQRLFSPDDAVDAFRQQMRLDVRALQCPEHVPHGLWALIRALVQAEPERRPQTARGVALALGRVVKLRRLNRRPQLIKDELAALFAEAFPGWRSPRTMELPAVQADELFIEVDLSELEETRSLKPPPPVESPTLSLPVVAAAPLPTMRERPRLGDVLVMSGLITAEQLEWALQKQRELARESRGQPSAPVVQGGVPTLHWPSTQ